MQWPVTQMVCTQCIHVLEQLVGLLVGESCDCDDTRLISPKDLSAAQAHECTVCKNLSHRPLHVLLMR